ncbi:HpcH/HpaI aldolase family protein [Sphingosinicella microcystinivorans]|uniref:HpcH/HpaI aldolase family protein n=1 Tax=Sphingosinicella microcystinivorans TaxID=335406 RepID=UPI0022F383E1|nr:aldolase/citrate lyase family protein [Sphingosinicella microcystinivorans]WBX84511.1 aldolase/citrate lyase family protein [Sphingosinicella microcystinivorans]
MEPLNPFKRTLADTAQTPIGTWLMSGAPSTAEALGFCGFDFLVVDMEHVPIGVPGTADILRAISGTPAQPVVRIAWNDQVLVKRVMDAGARTLMVPFVETADEALKAVSYTRYPPEGVRGVAAVHRGSRYGRVPDYLRRANDEVAVIVQLETPGAVSRLAEIAAVPGVDALFVGPGDLSAAMGHLGDIAHGDVQAAIADAARAARAAGKPIGIVGPNPDMVRRFIGYGYTFAAVASDMAMMTGRAAEWQAALRGETPAPTGEAAY